VIVNHPLLLRQMILHHNEYQSSAIPDVRALRVAVTLIQRHMEEDEVGCLGGVLQMGGIRLRPVGFSFEVGQGLGKL